MSTVTHHTGNYKQDITLTVDFTKLIETLREQTENAVYAAFENKGYNVNSVSGFRSDEDELRIQAEITGTFKETSIDATLEEPPERDVHYDPKPEQIYEPNIMANLPDFFRNQVTLNLTYSNMQTEYDE